MNFITVPINMDAKKRLDYDECIEGDLIDIVLSEEEFDDLWRSGVIPDINQALGLLIDAYESEEITGLENLMLLKKIVEKYMKKEPKNISLTYLMQQVENAIQFNTSVYFFF